MNCETPTFCKDIQESSFSTACETFSKFKPKKKIPLFSFSNLDSIHNNHKQKRHNHDKSKNKKKKRNHSVFFKARKYKLCYDIKDIMKKNKFILRNDFDKKNSKKFLLAKEKAFESPILFINDFTEKQ